MDHTHNLDYLLEHTASIIHRQSDQVLQERLGIGLSQFKILMMLQLRPHTQQRELADSLGQTEASISRQIKLLVERGMLLVEVNPHNRREHRTATTTKGIKIAQAAQEVVSEYYTPLMAQLSEKEQQQFIEMQTKIHAYVCGSGKSFACDQPFGA
jgi:DNA-binding MarR family transcriptional regulator